MKRIIGFSLIVGFLLVGLLACTTAIATPAALEDGGESASEAAAESESQAAAGEQYHFVFVTHDLGAGIFAPVRRGMEDACEQINATCEFLGPQQYDPAAQVDLIEAAIAKNPDGIATTRPEPGTYDDVIQKAQDAGILVIGFNTNDPTANEKLPIPFVGQDFTNYGVVWAHEVMEALPEGGPVAVTNCCFGHYALEERIRSFEETLADAGEDKWEVRDVINITTNENDAYAAVEAYYQANPDIKGIFGADYYTYVTAQFINRNELQDDLITGGSDLAPAMVEGLEEDYVEFGLGQNPYLQGYYPVIMMFHALEHGIRPISIDTGTDVVTPENINDYNPEFR